MTQDDQYHIRKKALSLYAFLGDDGSSLAMWGLGFEHQLVWGNKLTLDEELASACMSDGIQVDFVDHILTVTINS